MSRVLLVENHDRLARLMCKGLAICQAIAQAHVWHLSAARAELGLRLCLSHAPAP